MLCDKYNTSFTDEEKRNLTIRKFTKTELKANLKKFRDKQKRRRSVQLFLLVGFAILSIITGHNIRGLFILFFIAIFFLFGIDEHIASMNMKRARYEYYIEFYIVEKLATESYTKHTRHQETFTLWPVIGKDTTTGYISKFYIDHEQYVMLNIGDRARLRIPKDHIL